MNPNPVPAATTAVSRTRIVRQVSRGYRTAMRDGLLDPTVGHQLEVAARGSLTLLDLAYTGTLDQLTQALSDTRWEADQATETIGLLTEALRCGDTMTRDAAAAVLADPAPLESTRLAGVDHLMSTLVAALADRWEGRGLPDLDVTADLVRALAGDLVVDVLAVAVAEWADTLDHGPVRTHLVSWLLDQPEPLPVELSALASARGVRVEDVVVAAGQLLVTLTTGR